MTTHFLAHPQPHTPSSSPPPTNTHLDHHHMIGVFPRFVQDAVTRHHIIHHIALGDLLAAECLRCAEVHTIIITQVIVGYDRSGLETSTHEKVNQDALHFGLTTLKVVTADEDVVADCHLNATWVLGGGVRVCGGSVQRRGCHVVVCE